MGALQKLRSSLRTPAKVAQAVLRWKRISFDEAPPIFANSKPKSGSHLLLQVMQGLCMVAPYTYVVEAPIRSVKASGGRIDEADIANALRATPKGAIGWGYVDATSANTQVLCQSGRINYFIYRDPRDMLVSHVHYATSMHMGHGMNELYNRLPDLNARLKVAITGIDQDGLFMVNVAKRYEGVFQWLQQPHTLCLRFEDMINDQQRSLESILDEFGKAGYTIPTPRDQAIEILRDAIQPTRSHTFRSGKAGGWRDTFTAEHKDLFKQVAGDLLIRLGYEKNNDW